MANDNPWSAATLAPDAGVDSREPTLAVIGDALHLAWNRNKTLYHAVLDGAVWSAPVRIAERGATGPGRHPRWQASLSLHTQIHRQLRSVSRLSTGWALVPPRAGFAHTRHFHRSGRRRGPQRKPSRGMGRHNIRRVRDLLRDTRWVVLDEFAHPQRTRRSPHHRHHFQRQYSRRLARSHRRSRPL